jgi:hypothetical protein
MDDLNVTQDDVVRSYQDALAQCHYQLICAGVAIKKLQARVVELTPVAEPAEKAADPDPAEFKEAAE